MRSSSYILQQSVHTQLNMVDIKPFSPGKNRCYVKVVEEFRGHTEGENPDRKTRENAKQQLTHEFKFLEFMADSATPNTDLLFLTNHGRFCDFVAHLQAEGFKPTTQRNYLMNAVAFLKYVLNMSPPHVRLENKKKDQRPLV